MFMDMFSVPAAVTVGIIVICEHSSNMATRTVTATNEDFIIFVLDIFFLL